MESMKTMENVKSPNEIDNTPRFVALSASFTALVFIATAIFALAIVSSNGYFNFGESMVYLASLIGGPLVGLVSGALGSSLADVISGYGFYAPGTFVIKGIEGYLAGYLFLKLRKLDKSQIKKVYVIFSAFFLGLSIALTTPSLWGFVGNLVNGNINFGNFPLDIGSYNFSLLLNIYIPQFSNFNLLSLENFIVWNGTYFQIDIPGFTLIFLAIIFIALLWYLYLNYGEKSKIIISCAVAGSVIVIGYFMYETFNVMIPIGSFTLNYGLGYTPAQGFGELPFNVLQVIIGIVIALPVYTFLVNSGIISNEEEETSS